MEDAMRKRRVLGAALLFFLLLLVAALAVPPCRYFVLGHLRGEQSYQGYPTSYWCDELQAYSLAFTTPPSARHWDRLLQLLGLRAGASSPEVPCVCRGGLEALPVLAELLRVQDPSVRVLALFSIVQHDPPLPASRVVPLIALALRDKDWAVRLPALHALYARATDPEARLALAALREALQVEEGYKDRLFMAVVLTLVAGPEAREAVPVLRHGLRHDEVAVRRLAVLGLGRMGAVPELKEALNDPEDDIRALAAEALKVAGLDRSSQPR
jgi:HEAT repeat protein